MTIKVLHISPHYGGGVGSVVIDLVSYFQTKLLANNTIVSIDKCNTDYSDILRSLGVDFYEGLYFDFEAYNHLIKENDIVLVHHWNHPLLAFFLAGLSFPSCNIIFWSHSSGLYEPNIIPRFLFKDGARVAFSSKASLNILKEYNLLGSDCVSTIHSVRNLKKFVESGNKRRYTSSSNLLYIGTVSRQKMHPDICYIFKLSRRFL